MRPSITLNSSNFLTMMHTESRYFSFEEVLFTRARAMPKCDPMKLWPLQPGTPEFDAATELYQLAASARSWRESASQTNRLWWHDFASANPSARDPEIEIEVEYLVALVDHRATDAINARFSEQGVNALRKGLYRPPLDVPRANELHISEQDLRSWILSPTKGRCWGPDPKESFLAGRAMPPARGVQCETVVARTVREIPEPHEPVAALLAAFDSCQQTARQASDLSGPEATSKSEESVAPEESAHDAN